MRIVRVVATFRPLACDAVCFKSTIVDLGLGESAASVYSPDGRKIKRTFIKLRTTMRQRGAKDLRDRRAMVRAQRAAVCLALIVAVATAAAGPAYKFRAPDGSVIFTDKPLAPPFRLVKRLELTWGERQLRTPKPRTNRNAAAANRKKLGGFIAATAKKHRLPPELLHAVIEAESAYDPRAVSRAGAVGLMQLMPETAKRFGVSDRTDPRQNLDGGAEYLRFLLDYFSNDLSLALAGYNAGEKAVDRYNRQIPPYEETRVYVARVLKFFRRNLAQFRGRGDLTAMTEGSAATTDQPTIR
jgi:soluble lytic murein transglycosylase-like protein